MFLLDDLLYESDAFKEAASKGEIVYQEDYTVGSGPSRWNTDLVVGPPADSEDVQTQLGDDRPITEAEPGEIWLAIDAKSIMTEHQKARRNRQRDINSFADIMHRHHPGAVTGGVILVNAAEKFHSPLRDEDDITEHDEIERLVEETVDIFRDIDRAEGEISPNVDAVATIVVDHTNMEDGHETTLVESPPAPERGDIVHYRNFLDIIVDTLETRYFEGERPDFASANATLESQLYEEAVETAHTVRELVRDVEQDDVKEDSIEAFKDQIATLEGLADEIERKHT